MANKLLYPRNTATRQVVDLSGMWKFCFDKASDGEKKGYVNGLPAAAPDMPVPASFADFFTDKYSKEYTGDFWYSTVFFADPAWKDRDVDIRFFAAAHEATVYVNGKKVGEHCGGFLPFTCNLNDVLRYGKANTVAVKLNNELSCATLPCGEYKVLKDGTKVTAPYFDFFNYSGLIRPVKLVITPKISIVDITLKHVLKDGGAVTEYSVETSGEGEVWLSVYDEDGVKVAEASGVSGEAEISGVHLWQPLNAYLYTFVFEVYSDGNLSDSYPLEVGIRTVEIKGNRILVNGSPVYFKGFGKHEDAPVSGRGFNLPYIKRDFELMKWIGANSFRTSHYPYSEEIYQLADREGFLVIDELPAVGMLVSTRNAVDAATGAKVEPFFEKEIVQTVTIERHLSQLGEMITRDKNHACVVAWSLLNEPDTVGSDKAVGYFERLFDRCRELDVQNRPRSFAHIIQSQPDRCKCTHLCDFIMLNRYYGWYLKSGLEIVDAFDALDGELDKWEKTGKPVMFTEYGTDNMQGLTRLPSVMWAENYQVEYLEGYHKVFDKHPCVMGEQVWNFADFQTTEGLIRCDGNKKGIFTRYREPKMAAFELKRRWDALPLNYKGE